MDSHINEQGLQIENEVNQHFLKWTWRTTSGATFQKKNSPMKYLFSVMSILLATALAAQITDLQIQEQQAALQSLAKTAIVQQTGDGNDVQLNIDGDQNIAILQQGAGNLFNTNMHGYLNQAVTIQRGDGNTHQLSLSGSSNNVNVLQEGNSNTIIQDLQGVSELDILLSQYGSGHEIIQQEFGTSNTPISVTQQGSPMTIIIGTGGN
jgi:hypothetical protein